MERSKGERKNQERKVKYHFAISYRKEKNEEEALTLEIVEDLKKLPGVEKIAVSLHNTFDFQASLAAAFEISEGQVGFSEGSENIFFELFEFYSALEQEKFRTTAGDVMDFDVVDAGFIGVNEDFAELIEKDLLIWKSDRSSTDYSFNELFSQNNTCIIAKSIPSVLGIQEVGQYIRITFYDPLVQNDPGIFEIFRVVGISGGIPGFYNFRSNEQSATGGGILVSLDTYIRLMEVENPGEPNMIVDKVFLNLIEKTVENIEETKEDIRLIYQDRDFVIDDAISKINFMQTMTERQAFLMEIILSFTIMISIFGLVSNIYAIRLERKFKIGILRSMGLKMRNVRNMFLVESMIILLSSGILGTVIGTYTAYLLETNVSLLTEMPTIFKIPYETLFRVFIISISVGFLGTYVILIRISKQSIMDIFRQTF